MAPRWARVLGTLIIVILPLAVIAAFSSYVHHRSSVMVYAMLFLLVGASAQFGLVVRRWGNMAIDRLLFDLVLTGIGSVISWGVVDLAMRRGGGPVDPSLLAVIMAYLLTMWSGQHP